MSIHRHQICDLLTSYQKCLD